MSTKHYLMQLIELRMAVLTHCQAVKAACDLYAAGNPNGAIARLEGAVAALETSCRGMVIGSVMKCPTCGEKSELAQWADLGVCPQCGADLDAEDGPS